MAEPIPRTYRLPPCPAYDVEGMEGWLTDLAAQGLFLAEDGFFCGVATFEKGSPRQVRYRLEGAPRQVGFFSDGGGNPDQEAIDLIQACGWEYVARRDQFYIYRTFDPAARELHTDPDIQAQTLNAVKKRLRSELISSLIWLVLCLVLNTFHPLMTMLALGTPLTLLLTTLILLLLLRSLASVLHLRKLRKKLLTDGVLSGRENWKKGAVRYQVLNFLQIILIVLCVVLFLRGWSADIMDEGKIPLDQYTADPPFGTIADFNPQGNYQLESWVVPDYVQERTTWFAPVNLEWQEFATVTAADGSRISGGLYVDYHQTIAPLFARQLAEEYLREAKEERHYEPMEVTVDGMDFVAGYYNIIHSPSVILQKGNLVLHASFHEYNDSTGLALEDWLGVVAQCMK